MKSSPTFKIAIVVFGFIGFMQLIAVGSAYARRAGIEKEVIKLQQSPVVVLETVITTTPDVEPVIEPPRVITSANDIASRFAADIETKTVLEDDTDPMLNAGVVTFQPSAASFGYVIRHPQVEILLGRARDAYILGDMVEAVTRLEEAKSVDPSEAAVVDMEAQIAEGMGAYEKALDLYMTVYQMGVRVGPYFQRAATKIEKGVGDRMEDGAFMLLGTINISRDKQGKQAKLNVPIRAREGEFIVGTQVEITVQFYDLVNGGKIEKASSSADISYVFQNKKVNWNERKEESLEVRYTLPKTDARMEELFGKRKYYGQVIELYYKGKIQDVVAHPRSLHYVHAQKNAKSNEFDDGFDEQLELLDDYNLYNPLLPQKPR